MEFENAQLWNEPLGRVFSLQDSVVLELELSCGIIVLQACGIMADVSSFLEAMVSPPPRPENKEEGDAAGLRHRDVRPAPPPPPKKFRGEKGKKGGKRGGGGGTPCNQSFAGRRFSSAGAGRVRPSIRKA